MDLKLGPWLLCVLAVALPMGFTGILAVIATIGAQRSVSWGPRDWVVLGAFWCLTLAYAPVLIRLSKLRHRFLRRTPAQQWRRAVLLATLMGLLLVASVGLIVRYL